MRAVVVTGTGTGVGKTYVTRALRRTLEANRRVLALKPIETGYDPTTCDARVIGGESWLAPLYAFAEPVSPHLAARRAGAHVELDRVVEWVRRAWQEAGDDDAVVLVEGAGGLLTPLDERGTSNLDLVRRLEPCRWLLVAPNRLGVLHDVRAAVQVAVTSHRGPDAVLLSCVPEEGATSPVGPADSTPEFWNLARATNPTELARFVDAPIYSVSPEAELPAALVAHLLG